MQQSFIMHRNGVKVELFDNVKATFARRRPNRRPDGQLKFWRESFELLLVIARSKATKQSTLPKTVHGLLRFARNDGWAASPLLRKPFA